MPGELQSKPTITMPSKKLQKLLGSIYHQYQKLDDPKANARAKHDFIFHMTDWLDDLRRLTAIYEHPEKYDRQSAGCEVAGFLYHVVPHLKAAGRLLLDSIPDAFENDEKDPRSDPITLERKHRRPPPSPEPH